MLAQLQKTPIGDYYNNGQPVHNLVEAELKLVNCNNNILKFIKLEFA